MYSVARAGQNGSSCSTLAPPDPVLTPLDYQDTTTVPSSTRRSTVLERPTTRPPPPPSSTRPSRPSPPWVRSFRFALSSSSLTPLALRWLRPLRYHQERLRHHQGNLPRCQEACRHPPQVPHQPHLPQGPRADLAQVDLDRLDLRSRSLPGQSPFATTLALETDC